MRLSSTTLPLPVGYLWQYHLLLWMQSFHTPVLDKVASYLTYLGTEWFYVLVLPILFWSVNRTIGLRVTYVFLSSMYVNAWLKDAVLVARPIGLPGIRSWLVSTGTGYSFPSGHAQGSATFWMLTSRAIRRGWFWLLSIVLIAGIGASRLYLGLHWPLDVLVGWALGLVFGLLGWSIGKWWTYRQYTFPIRLAFAAVIPLFGILVRSGPASLEYAALLLGVGVGAVVEERFMRLHMDKALWKRVCAAIIGVAGLAALYLLFRWAVFLWITSTSEPSYSMLAAARDLLMGLWGTIGAPFLFYLGGLYTKAS